MYVEKGRFEEAPTKMIGEHVLLQCKHQVVCYGTQYLHCRESSDLLLQCTFQWTEKVVCINKQSIQDRPLVRCQN